MFEGQRVRLRALQQDDLPLFHRWWSDPEIARFQVGGTIRLNQESTNITMLERWFGDTGNDVGFTIALRESGEAIGFVNLWGANVKNRSGTLGILLGKPFWSQGYGSEALGLVLDYAFREMNLHRVELGVYAFNDRAIHVYQKLGFREVGRRRETLYRDGQWYDDVIMDVLQREYLGQQ